MWAIVNVDLMILRLHVAATCSFHLDLRRSFRAHQLNTHGWQALFRSTRFDLIMLYISIFPTIPCQLWIHENTLCNCNLAVRLEAEMLYFF